MDNTMKKCGHRQMKCVNMNVNWVEIHTPPSIGFLVACIVVRVIAHEGSRCRCLSLPRSHHHCVMCSGLTLKNIISSLVVDVKERRHRQKGIHYGPFIEQQVITKIMGFTSKDLITFHSIEVKVMRG